MSDKLSDKEIANLGLKAYSIQSNHQLNTVLKSVEGETLETLNFKKNLPIFKRFVKSLSNRGNDEVSPIPMITNYANPLLHKCFEFYAGNPEETKSLIESISKSSNIEFEKFGVNEITVQEFMKKSAEGSAKDGIGFIYDALLGQLGYVPRLMVEDKIRKMKKSFEDATFGSAVKTNELSRQEKFGCELMKLSENYMVSLKDLLTNKELAPHLSTAYSTAFGISGFDYAKKQANLSSLVYAQLTLVDEFKDSFLPSDITGQLKSFKISESGLVASIFNSQIDLIAKKNLGADIKDYVTLGKSFGKHTVTKDVEYVNHFK